LVTGKSLKKGKGGLWGGLSKGRGKDCTLRKRFNYRAGGGGTTTRLETGWILQSANRSPIRSQKGLFKKITLVKKKKKKTQLWGQLCYIKYWFGRKPKSMQKNKRIREKLAKKLVMSKKPGKKTTGAVVKKGYKGVEWGEKGPNLPLLLGIKKKKQVNQSRSNDRDSKGL